MLGDIHDINSPFCLDMNRCVEVYRRMQSLEETRHAGIRFGCSGFGFQVSFQVEDSFERSVSSEASRFKADVLPCSGWSSSKLTDISILWRSHLVVFEKLGGTALQWVSE